MCHPRKPHQIAPARGWPKCVAHASPIRLRRPGANQNVSPMQAPLGCARPGLAKMCHPRKPHQVAMARGRPECVTHASPTRLRRPQNKRQGPTCTPTPANRANFPTRPRRAYPQKPFGTHSTLLMS